MKKEETKDSLSTSNPNTQVSADSTSNATQKPKSTKRKVWIWCVVAYVVVSVCIGAIIIQSLQKTPEHNFSEDYKTDETYHWKYCKDCDEIAEKGEHEYDDCLDDTCNVCGYIRTAGHVYDGYASDETNHWQVCENCNATTTAESHTFDSGKCTVCDYIQVTEGLSYNYIKDENVYSVRVGNAGSLKYIRIPETYDDGKNGEHPVAKISDGWAFGTSEINDVPLVEIVIPESVTYIGWAAFNGCNNLLRITIPKDAKVESAAFAGCANLTEVTFLGNVTFGNRYAYGQFYACTSLTDVNLPAGLTSISASAFAGCPIENITLAGESSVYHLENGCLIETATKKLVLGTNNAVIPTDGSVETIGEYAFSGRTGKLTKVVYGTTEWDLPIINIPEGIKTIEAYAFYSVLEDSGFGVIVPKSVETLDIEAFELGAGELMIFYAGDMSDYENLLEGLGGEDDLDEQITGRTDLQESFQTNSQGKQQVDKQGESQTNGQTNSQTDERGGGQAGSQTDTSKDVNDSGSIDETGVTNGESSKNTTGTVMVFIYSETEPSAEGYENDSIGGYWHYENGVITIWGATI